MKLNLNKKKKKILSFAVLILSLSVSGYLMFAPTGKNGEDGNFVVKIASGGQDKKPDPSLVFQANQLENLTLDFANKTFSNAISNNLYQGNGQPSILPPDSSDVEKTISQIIDQEYSTEVVKDSDVTVGTDDSKNAQRIYVLYVNQVMSNLPSFSSGPQNSQDQNSLQSLFSASAQNLNTTIALLEEIKVPPSWVKIHKDLLSLLIHQKNIFESLSKANDDPIRFMIALYQASPSEFDKAFQEVKAEINQKIKDEALI